MIFGSLFRPRHSIALPFDKFQPEDSDSFFEQVEEVKKYYRFTTLSDLVANPKGGHAALLFENARKGAFLTILPVLIAEKIPFTVFLRTDCIGTNRLPIEEEFEAYRKSYPEKTTHLIENSIQSREELRAKLGPFPVEKTDPLDYFVTWGRIKELPPLSFELGLCLPSVYDDKYVSEELDFIEKQTQRRPKVALFPRGNTYLKRFGIQAVVTLREGEIDSSTNVFDLPRYILKKND